MTTPQSWAARGRTPVQLVIESAVHPRFIRSIVVTRLDVFAHDVCEMPTEPCDFLLEPEAGALHKFQVTAIPHFIAVLQSPWHVTAVRLDGMTAEELGVQWRKLAMPIDGRLGCCHSAPPSARGCV